MYSKYDITRNEYSKLRNKRFLLLSLISLIFTSITFLASFKLFLGLSNFIYVLPFLFSIFISDKLLISFSQVYSTKRKREYATKMLICDLRDKMKSLIKSIDKRSKGQQFKKAYDFTGKSVAEFEYTLSFAMHHEVKEVWVTAFCKSNIVLKVTATIGSARSCKPSDSVSSWIDNIRRLRCDEIRQYHNHPVNNNQTDPSTADISSNISMRKQLSIYNNMLRTFIVFWNDIYEYRILEYKDNGETKILYFFDVSTI